MKKTLWESFFSKKKKERKEKRIKFWDGYNCEMGLNSTEAEKIHSKLNFSIADRIA